MTTTPLEALGAGNGEPGQGINSPHGLNDCRLASNAVIKELEAAYKNILSYTRNFIYYENILHNYSSDTRLCCKSI